MKSFVYIFLASLAVASAEEQPIFLEDFAEALRQASNNETTTTSEAPTEVPVEAPFAATLSPTFREGDVPTVFDESSEIVNPVFVAPVAPPPISRAATQQQLKLSVTLLMVVVVAVAAGL